ARSTRGISYDDLAKKIGTKDATYLAAALHGQHRLNADEAKRLAEVLGVSVELATVTTALPLRADFPLTTDPFKYRSMELVGVYGDALRERCQEMFGDGILSAIDCVVKLEKRGERGLITIDAKFLHYKEFGEHRRDRRDERDHRGRSGVGRAPAGGATWARVPGGGGRDRAPAARARP